MQRKAMAELMKWKEQTQRNPLIIRGARQVGKTWLMKEFGKNNYKKCAYINFDSNERMQGIFKSNLDIPRLVAALSIESGVDINSEDTLLIFDEVQEVPRALTSLKYFCENAPEYNIVAAGSLLGVALHRGTSFPVGKVEFLDLYPLDFEEFLDATGNGAFTKLLIQKDFETITTFKSKYIELLKTYYFLGGMPEVVAKYLTDSNLDTARLIQRRILDAYEQDVSKHAPNEVVPRIRMLWNSLPSQLARENRKFNYGLIKEGARAREYELAIAWLVDCGLVLRVNKVSKPAMPLAAYLDQSAFKLYMLDVGLLGALSGLDAVSVIEGNKIFTEFKGALTEQYVLQQIVATALIRPYYWTADRAQAEVDFVFQNNYEIFPLEVKAEENLQSKSLRSFFYKFQPERVFRTSMSDYRVEDWVTNVPLYAVSSLLRK